MSRDNPFSDNPFSDSSLTPYTNSSTAGLAGLDPPAPPATNTGSAWGASNGGGAWGSSTSKVRDAPLMSEPANPPNVQNQALRVDSIDAREKALKQKEAELKRWEEDLRKAGANVKRRNWPKFCPFLHHDIPGDVPEGNQWMVRKVYWSYLGLVLCLTVNFAGGICALIAINPSNGRLIGFFLAALYFACGIPGAWVLWYRRLYNAAIKDRAVTYAWFFIMYFVHLVFSTWSAVAPPFPGTNDWSHTGYLTGIKSFDRNVFVGVVYVVGAGLWTIEVLWSLLCLRWVYMSFRSGGGGKALKRELAQSAARNAVV